MALAACNRRYLLYWSQYQWRRIGLTFSSFAPLASALDWFLFAWSLSSNRNHSPSVFLSSNVSTVGLAALSSRHRDRVWGEFIDRRRRWSWTLAGPPWNQTMMSEEARLQT
jgi:hypothetical protein